MSAGKRSGAFRNIYIFIGYARVVGKGTERVKRAERVPGFFLLPVFFTLRSLPVTKKKFRLPRRADSRVVKGAERVAGEKKKRLSWV